MREGGPYVIRPDDPTCSVYISCVHFMCAFYLPVSSFFSPCFYLSVFLLPSLFPPAYGVHPHPFFHASRFDEAEGPLLPLPFNRRGTEMAYLAESDKNHPASWAHPEGALIVRRTQGDVDSRAVVRQMQRTFAFLAVGERRYYDPRDWVLACETLQVRVTLPLIRLYIMYIIQCSDSYSH